MRLNAPIATREKMQPPGQDNSRENFKKLSVHFVKFGIVGVIGALINLAFFFCVVDLLGMNANLGSVLGFMLAVTSNYTLNENWTFRTKGERFSFKPSSYLRYIGVNILGLLANLAVLNLIILCLQPPLKVVAQAGGIAAGMLFNFICSKIFVFQK